MPNTVRVSAWLPYRGYFTFERYLDDDGAPLPMVQALFHCVKRHAVSAQSLQECRRLTQCLDTGEYTGVGLVMLMPENRCPVCRAEQGLEPYDDAGLLTSESPPPDECVGGA